MISQAKYKALDGALAAGSIAIIAIIGISYMSFLQQFIQYAMELFSAASFKAASYLESIAQH